MIKMSKKTGLILSLVALVLVFSTVGGVTLAKYAFRAERSETVTPTPFYFSCNFDNGGIYYLPSNSTKVSVYNHNSVQGNLKVNSENITYKVTYQKTNGDGSGFVTDLGSYTLTGGAEDKKDFTVSGELGDNYHVTVTTSKPYVTTIEFDLIFMEADATSFYTVTRSVEGNWLQLDVYVGMTKPTSLTINYGTLAPDNTNPFMTDWLTSAGTGTIEGAKLSDHAHYTFIFFGNVSGCLDVTKDDPGVPTVDTSGNLTITLPTSGS